jgi:hypothetical protein
LLGYAHKLILQQHSLMNLLKWKAFPVASLLLAVLVLGCRPERMQTAAVNPRKMTFAQAGVSLVVGEEWQCQNINSNRGLYPPTLVSQAGSIRVVLLPPDRSEPEVVADGLRAAFDLNPRAAKHSFRKQKFASETGAQVLCVSYLQQAGAKEGQSTMENSHYLVKNGAGRCVVINYLASADARDTSATHRMLRTSLSLQ